LKRAGDHAANLERAIANTEERASKERAHFDDKKNVETLYGPREPTRLTSNSAGNCGPKKASARAPEARASKKHPNPTLDQPKRD